jgi:hypothetical protein
MERSDMTRAVGRSRMRRHSPIFNPRGGIYRASYSIRESAKIHFRLRGHGRKRTCNRSKAKMDQRGGVRGDQTGAAASSLRCHEVAMDTDFPSPGDESPSGVIDPIRKLLLPIARLCRVIDRLNEQIGIRRLHRQRGRWPRPTESCSHRASR